MIALQVICFLIVAAYLIVRARRERRAVDLLARLAMLSVAAWIGEDSVIRAYGFYRYSDGWNLFIDRVPLAIIIIWPVVIHSAWDLARAFGGSRVGAPWKVPLIAAALVLADASLIEPIAVESGLWRWSEPGVFAVPPIGILGWAFFAGACVMVMEWTGRALLALVVAPLFTHVLLVASWWTVLRWVSAALPAWPAVLLAWIAAALLAPRAFRSRARVPEVELWARLPGALFFFGLLALAFLARGQKVLPLGAYALAFAPPYLALLAQRRRTT
jgi:uncharacterized membrane protein